MNKLQKLSELNKDIEILERSGLYKAANVLHNKFIKEADTDLVYLLDSYKKDFEKYFDKVIFDNYDKYSLNQAAKALKNLESLENSNNPEIVEEAKRLLSMFRPRYKEFTTRHLLNPNTNKTGPTQQSVTQSRQSVAPQSAKPLLLLSNFNNESEFYNTALSKIQSYFNTQNSEDIDIGEKIYTDTIAQFTKAQTKKQFANQVQNLRARYIRR